MNSNSVTKLFLIAAIVLFVVAPFAGLAPLLLLLFGTAIVWGFKSIVQPLFTGETSEEIDSQPSENP